MIMPTRREPDSWGFSKDAAQVRATAGITAVLHGTSRSDAANVGGMDRQTLRDWVIRFDDEDLMVSLRVSGDVETFHLGFAELDALPGSYACGGCYRLSVRFGRCRAYQLDYGKASGERTER
jgi:hypothetical protein